MYFSTLPDGRAAQWDHKMLLDGITIMTMQEPHYRSPLIGPHIGLQHPVPDGLSMG